MNLITVRELAQTTSIPELLNYITKIYNGVEEHPDGWDVEIPRSIIDKVEKICDDLSIPCTKIGIDCLSVAATYRQLSERELIR